MDTLVLNNAYIPIDRVPWQDAITSIVTGSALLVEAYENRVVRSARDVFEMPSVIQKLTNAGVFQKSPRFSRHNIWLRDKGRCCYCDVHVAVDAFTYEHVIPRSRGGGTTWANIVVACLKCNNKKADKTPAEAGMRLLREPHVPKTLPTQVSPVLQWREGMPLVWRDYMESVRYWHAKLT